MREPDRRDLPASAAEYVLPADRLCPGCGVRRPLSEWAVDRSKPSGFKSLCKVCDRARARAYYGEHREAVLARVAARRPPAEPRACSECGVELAGRARLTCGSSRCREARFRRLHPEAWAAREARKVERRRERRREARESG